VATTVLDTLITRFLYAVDASQLEKAERSLGRIEAKANQVGDALLGAGAVLTGALAGSAVVLAQKEQELARLGNAADLSNEQLRDLNGVIYQVAHDNKLKESALVVGMNEMITRTGDMEYTVETLDAVALGMQAAGDKSTAIAGVTAEFKKLNIASGDALTALDLLTVQGKAGSFELADMARLGPRIISAYAASNRQGIGSLRELGTVMQVIRQNTGNAESAATTFEALMRNLTSPAKIKRLEQMGVNVDFASRGINDMFKDIIRATGGDLKIINTIFDAEAARGFGTAIAEFKKTGAFETLDKVYSVQADGTTITKDAQRNIDLLISSWDRLVTMGGKAVEVLGEAGLTGMLHSLADFIANALDIFMLLPEWMQAIVALAFASGPAILAMGTAFKLAAWSAGGLQAMLSILSATGLAGAIKQFAVITRATGLWSAAQWALNAALTANPIGVIVMGLAAMGAALIRVIAIWDDLYAIFQKDGFMSAVGRFFNFFGDDEEEPAPEGDESSKGNIPSKGGKPSQVQQALAQANAFVGGQSQMPSSPVGGASTTTNSTVRQDNSVRTVHVDKVEVSVPNGDAKQIASNVAGELKDQSRRVHQGFDSKIAE